MEATTAKLEIYAQKNISAYNTFFFLREVAKKNSLAEFKGNVKDCDRFVGHELKKLEIEEKKRKERVTGDWTGNFVVLCANITYTNRSRLVDDIHAYAAYFSKPRSNMFEFVGQFYSQKGLKL